MYVKTADLGWSDLGSWKALYDCSPKNRDGNVTQNCNVLEHECENTIFAVEGAKLSWRAGLRDYIVADTENALLIYPVAQEQRSIRQVVNDVKSRFGEEYVVTAENWQKASAGLSRWRRLLLTLLLGMCQECGFV